MGIDFNNILRFPDLWVWLFVKIHSLVSFLGISGILGMIFRKFCGYMGILFRYFSGLMGNNFTI